MKKIVLVSLVAFVLLFSLSAGALAEEQPKIRMRLAMSIPSHIPWVHTIPIWAKEVESMSNGSPARNYSAFDLELTHQALNVRLFIRLLSWMRPYRMMLFVSIALVILGAVSSVLLPVLGGRVIIDTVLLPPEK